MFTLIAIGVVGGLITGFSPCILPVLPVILLSGAQSARVATGTTAASASVASAPATPARPSRAASLRLYRVIAGLVVSFSAVTFAGSALLPQSHLPLETIRWLALFALVAIGVGLIFPAFEAPLDKPFSWPPQKQFGSGRSGFGLGLALRVLYVPCAGPVLAAIVIAGAAGGLARHLGVEPIAVAGHQLDQFPLIVAERSSEIADAFEQTVVADMDVRPDRLHQLLLAEHAAGICRKQLQHLERLRPKLDLAAIGPAQLGALLIEFKAGESQHHAPHDPLEPFDETAGPENGPA